MCGCIMCLLYACVVCVHGVYAVGRGQLRINKIENVGKALTFLTQEKKVCYQIFFQLSQQKPA